MSRLTENFLIVKISVIMLGIGFRAVCMGPFNSGYATCNPLEAKVPYFLMELFSVTLSWPNQKRRKMYEPSC